MGTLKEALAELKSRVKPYNSLNPVMYQGTFSNTIKSIEWGFAKPKTIESFLNKFGYVKDGENWVLKLSLEHVKNDGEKLVYNDGKITGVLVKFGEADAHGDVFLPGCFDNTDKAPYFLDTHNPSVKP